MAECMDGLSRTHTCGELDRTNLGEHVTLMGWVHRRRDHGGVIFIDIRDRYGLTQVVFKPDSESLMEKARRLKQEYVVAASGVVDARPEDMVNRDLKTGEIEVRAADLRILNEARTPPFVIEDEAQANEDLRLKYRYLDLRNRVLKDNMVLRHTAASAVREHLNRLGFLEIETPLLVKRTPEGARDFLVPSRLNPGEFYALPQSPQLYKQIIMIAGFDKYYQLPRCLRDEDLRADRQPEFTQIDIEMSFVNEEDVYRLGEGLMKHVWKRAIGVDIETPFQRISYDESMARFGTDKPDLRFGLEIREITDLVGESSSDMLKKACRDGGAFAVASGDAAGLSRKNLELLEAVAAKAGAAGLAWGKVIEGKGTGMARFFEAATLEKMAGLFGSPGDMLFLIVAGERAASLKALGAVRLELARLCGLAREGEHRFAWITEFPIFEWDGDENRWAPSHHMFSMPAADDLDLLETDPGKVHGRVYDMVYNGIELGSGSVRCHIREIQERVMRVIGLDGEEARRRFGFLLEAFEYGAPPHGGIALGFDRIAAVLAGKTSIRDVIAFPKTTSGASLMDECPSPVEDEDLRELHLKLDLPQDA